MAKRTVAHVLHALAAISFGVGVATAITHCELSHALARRHGAGGGGAWSGGVGEALVACGALLAATGLALAAKKIRDR